MTGVLSIFYTYLSTYLFIYVYSYHISPQISSVPNILLICTSVQIARAFWNKLAYFIRNILDVHELNPWINIWTRVQCTCKLNAYLIFFLPVRNLPSIPEEAGQPAKTPTGKRSSADADIFSPAGAVSGGSGDFAADGAAGYADFSAGCVDFVTGGAADFAGDGDYSRCATAGGFKWVKQTLNQAVFWIESKKTTSGPGDAKPIFFSHMLDLRFRGIMWSIVGRDCLKKYLINTSRKY